jgi:localization factor PodJL
MAMHNLAALYAAAGSARSSSTPPPSGSRRRPSRGMKDSQFNLGMLYARGLGVKQDLEQLVQVVRARGPAWRRRCDQGARRHRRLARRGDGAGARGRSGGLRARADRPRGQFRPDRHLERRLSTPASRSPDRGGHGRAEGAGAARLRCRHPDGLAGPKTAEAIRTFERATGMSESGAINPRLLAVLGSQPV